MQCKTLGSFVALFLIACGAGPEEAAPAVVEGSLTTVRDAPEVDPAPIDPFMNVCFPAAFTDIPSTHYARPELRCLTSQCVIVGERDASGRRVFRPDEPASRAVLARITARAAGLPPVPASSGQQTFEDVPTSHWAFDYIESLARHGIVQGTSCGSASLPCVSGRPYFQPAVAADKASTAKVIAGALKLRLGTPATQSFEDVPISHPLHAHVEALKAAGYVKGVACGGDGEPCGAGNRPYFRPAQIATRALVSKMVADAMFNVADCPAASAPGQPIGTREVLSSADKEDTIVNPAVVDDPRASNETDGHLSFRYLMEQMAPAGEDPAIFVRDWLSQFAVSQTVEQGVTIPVTPRPRLAEFIDTWPKLKDGRLDLARAPFKLNAVVDRVDRGEDGPLDAEGSLRRHTNGELRMVYRLERAGKREDFALIFEFQLPMSSPKTLWAHRFHALGAFPTWDDAYRRRLEVITDGVVERGAGGPLRVNGSALAQLRTNEKVLGDKAQLREFRLQNGRLRLVSVKGTPRFSLNGSAELNDFLAENEARPKPTHAAAFVIPAALAGAEANEEEHDESGRGAGPFRTFWRAKAAPGKPQASSQAIALFGKFTCNGCHNGTQQANAGDVVMPTTVGGLYQVSPVVAGSSTNCERLSDFVVREEIPRRRVARARLLMEHPDPFMEAAGPSVRELAPAICARP